MTDLRTMILCPATTLLFLGLAACNEIPQTPAANETTAAQWKPEPIYAERRKGIYYYVGTVSENDKKDGRAAPTAHGFKYLGKNAEGEFALLAVDQNGGEILKATCADPCKIIHTSEGEAVAYDPSTVIGNAFQDAINGFLEIEKPKR